MNSGKLLVVVLCAVAVAGCAGKSSDRSLANFAWFQDDQRITGPDPLIDAEKFEKIDLEAVLANTDTNYQDKIDDTPAKQIWRLDQAIINFDKKGDRENIIRDRNRVQERIIAASNQRCGLYKNFIKQFDAAANLTLGGLTTATAGAGAIFTNIDVVRALAGVASILSGLRAELNEAYFQNLTIQVITDGFESKRREIYKEIVEQRRSSNDAGSYQNYPITKAIGDAILYHQHCSLIAGLEQAALSIQRAENPGITAINRTLRQLSATRVWMAAVTGEKTISEAVAAEEETKFMVAGPKPLESFGKAKEALENLKIQKEFLAETKAIVKIKTPPYDATKDKQKALQDALQAYDAKATGDALLSDIDTLVNDANTEISVKKDDVGKWSVKVAEAGAMTAELRSEGTELAAYHDKLTEKWNEKITLAKDFKAKMAKFMNDALKAGLKISDLDLADLQSATPPAAASAPAPPVPTAAPLPPPTAPAPAAPAPAAPAPAAPQR